MTDQPPSRPNRPNQANDTSPSSSRSKPSRSEPRKVLCAKLRKELPGLPAPPFQSPLGQRIYDSISLEAWWQWLEHSQMFINEKELRLSDSGARQIWMEECERFLFGSGASPPPGWVPPAGFVRLTKKKDSEPK